MKFSSVKRNVYGKTAGFTSSRNDASSSAMMACLKGAVVIDAPKWGWDRHCQLAGRRVARFLPGGGAPPYGNLGVSNTRALFLYSEIFILSFSLNIDERSQ